jgi:hypothetical protein
MEIISIREFARRVDASDTTIRKYINRGKIGRDAIIKNEETGQPKLYYEKALEYWLQYNEPIPDQNPAEPLEQDETNEQGANQEPQEKKPQVKTKDNRPSISDRIKFKKELKNPDPAESKEPKQKKIKFIPAESAEENIDRDKNTILNAEVRSATAKAHLQEIELQKKLGSLVSLAEVKKALYVFGAEIRDALLSLPERVVDDVLSSDNRTDAINILHMAINKALVSLSDIDKRKYAKDENGTNS